MYILYIPGIRGFFGSSIKKSPVVTLLTHKSFLTNLTVETHVTGYVK